MNKSEKNIEKHSTRLLKTTDRLALGYESNRDFCYGYLFGLLHAGKITIKERNILDKVFGHKNDNCRYAIENGKLIDYGE